MYYENIMKERIYHCWFIVIGSVIIQSFIKIKLPKQFLKTVFIFFFNYLSSICNKS